ncbi:hypothetical protein [Paeniglutamicibacter antarcticus]|uniref:Uncharacterized protein n=1 Tax=Paeniglutamicibacter antarcticus TaxID=494023 RepID=A0ABP9TRD7_9MICC
MYQPVDFVTPQLYLAVAGVLAVFALPMGIHALLRWRKYRKDNSSSQNWAQRRDLGIESGIAALGLIGALICVGAFGLGWKQSANNLVANIETRYAVSDVAMTKWNGSSATVDLTDGTGLPAKGIEVSFNAVGAPLLRDVEYGLDPQHAVEHSLELR